jgi:hypothetical protein
MTAAERAAASRAAQGLPPTVEDPSVLARIATLLTAGPVEIGVRDAA